jgi:hypothetical protein
MRRTLAVLMALLLAPISPAAAQRAAGGLAPLSAKLPDLWEHLNVLDAGIRGGTLTSTDGLISTSRAFYTPERMDHIETVIPGWKHMASYEHGKTLWHVNLAMVALLRLDEYRAMPLDQQIVQQWIVLLHDLAKEPEGGRDHRHSFRSAAKAARILPTLGFPVRELYASSIDAWFALADTAVVFNATRSLPVQDNAKLPAIMGGIGVMFPEPTRSAVAAIALHQSFTSLAAWPVMAPMSQDEVKHIVDAGMVPALRALMLADSGGWNLFDPPTLEAMYTETRGVFAALPR